MQRRIGIAQALINDPELLILDEPTTGLDPIGTRQVKDLILELGRRGKTVILSSHLLTDVEDVVDRMVILYGGRIHGEGSCDELLTSGDRTSIETDELDDETIAEIDALIRGRSGGEKSIRSVSAPRQKLEELFLGIVEKAREEQTHTSGATEGGSTAAFLKGEAAPVAQGAALISSLIAGDSLGDDVQEMTDAESPIGDEAGDHSGNGDGGVLESLLNVDEPDLTPIDEPTESEKSAAGAPDEDVDLGVIGSLVDDEDDEEESGKESDR
ncbi:MAG: hypothetical protein JKY96_06905 [Phycisphaerales bacterium]|nr:hypothetical protein [Phycisphaerales bacterium]